MKLQQRKLTRVVLFAAVVLALIPLSATFTRIVDARKDEVVESLRIERVRLNRKQRDFQRLAIFSNSLQQEDSLRKLVEATQADLNNWQTPMAYTRVKILDAIDQYLTHASNVKNTELEWLDAKTAPDGEPGEVKRLWLVASVTDVSSGLELLKALNQWARPFSIQEQGCGYRAVVETNDLEMRCLLSLATWALPTVKYDKQVVDEVIGQINQLPRRTLEDTPPSDIHPRKLDRLFSDIAIGAHPVAELHEPNQSQQSEWDSDSDSDSISRVSSNSSNAAGASTKKSSFETEQKRTGVISGPGGTWKIMDE